MPAPDRIPRSLPPAALAALAAALALVAAPGWAPPAAAQPAAPTPAAAPADTLPAVAAPPPSPRELQRNAQELEELREQIRRQRRELDDLSSLRQDEESELRAVGREMELVRKLLAGLDARERGLEAEIDSVQLRLQAHADQYERHRQRLAARLRAIHRRGPRRDLEMALTAGSFSALVSRLKFAAMVARLDENLVASTRRSGLEVLAERQRLQTALTEIWESREEARLERRRLAELEESHRGALAVTDRRRERLQARLQGLEDRERQLQQMLAELERRRAAGAPEAGPGFDGRLGRLAWPLEGPVVQPYGRSIHPEFKTVTVSNGIAIAAPLGSPVQAVEAGVVAYADRLPGFGQCVIVEHGAGYYSLYANLGRVFAPRGGRVARGEVLAEVGPAEEGDPRLYFELRLGKTPLDPTAWLEPRLPAR